MRDRRHTLSGSLTIILLTSVASTERVKELLRCRFPARFPFRASPRFAGCASSGPDQRANYAALPAEKSLPAMPLDKIDPELRRQQVTYASSHSPGTIVIDTPARRLYYILGDNQATLRHRRRPGRVGILGWRLCRTQGGMAELTPTENMQRREERYRKLAGGMFGGPNNPLGARAIYPLSRRQRHALRVHGTNQPESIGLAMSSGCIRMLNHDVIDLYDRVPLGAQVWSVIQAQTARAR